MTCTSGFEPTDVLAEAYVHFRLLLADAMAALRHCPVLRQHQIACVRGQGGACFFMTGLMQYWHNDLRHSLNDTVRPSLT